MKKARDNRTTEPLVKKKREQVEKSKKEAEKVKRKPAIGKILRKRVKKKKK